MIRAFIIGGRVYEMQSPSMKNIILACDILGELPQEGTLNKYSIVRTKKHCLKCYLFLLKGICLFPKNCSKGVITNLLRFYKLYMKIFYYLSKVVCFIKQYFPINGKPKMKVEKDISGFDAVDKWEGDLWDAVADIGLNAVQFAKENGEYKNHTHNLRNAQVMRWLKTGK